MIGDEGRFSGDDSTPFPELLNIGDVEKDDLNNESSSPQVVRVEPVRENGPAVTPGAVSADTVEDGETLRVTYRSKRTGNEQQKTVSAAAPDSIRYKAGPFRAYNTLVTKKDSGRRLWVASRKGEWTTVSHIVVDPNANIGQSEATLGKAVCVEVERDI